MELNEFSHLTWYMKSEQIKLHLKEQCDLQICSGINSQ